MSRVTKTSLVVEVDDKNFSIKYSGALNSEPETREEFKHDSRLMEMLMSDEKIFDLFYRIVTPVVRYKRRKARKELQKQNKEQKNEI